MDMASSSKMHRDRNFERPPSGTRLKTSTSLIVFMMAVLLYMPLTCQSHLLTNIFNTNTNSRLSEITDVENRYLLIENRQALAAMRDDDASVAAALSSPRDADLDTNQSNAPSTELIEPLPEPMAMAGNTWKSSTTTSTTSTSNAQTQQQRAGSSARLSNADLSRVPGEPSVAESISTEFPNPNINNLGHEITKILKKFFLHGYDKRVRPNYSGPPVMVNISFHIIGISSVDEVQMDFTTDFYFRQKWYDPRLEFDPVGEVDELCVGAEFAEKIWLPDTFFANEKTATFHKATTENTFIRIAHNGRVYRSIRLTVTCSCPMDLQYFPMDRQRCKIEIESYGYNTRDIDYRWERGDASVSLQTNIELPQFKILGFKMGQEIQNLSSGDYIRLYCEIHFVRSMGYYLIQIYIPASLIVMISWVSFWLHRNATPARVALGVTTVLTMTTLMSSTNAALPKISYIKSIDVFLGTCFVMVFASLLEYASVGYIGKRIAMKRKRLQDLQQMQQHHQKVCVAAAASAAAAAAAAAHEGDLVDVNLINQHAGIDHSVFADSIAGAGGLQTLKTRPLGAKMMASFGAKTLQRTRASRYNGRGDADADAYLTGIDHSSQTQPNQRTSLLGSIDSHGNGNGTTGGTTKRRLNQNMLDGTSTGAKSPLLAAGAAIAAAAAANQNSHAPTTEFEVNITQDMITICGLTPSAIDKHSRVVFPICFVCFNLMYWIIYGHISQQIEDRGPPLIPFIKS